MTKQPFSHHSHTSRCWPTFLSFSPCLLDRVYERVGVGVRKTLNWRAENYGMAGGTRKRVKQRDYWSSLASLVEPDVWRHFRPQVRPLHTTTHTDTHVTTHTWPRLHTPNTHRLVHSDLYTLIWVQTWTLICNHRTKIGHTPSIPNPSLPDFLLTYCIMGTVDYL